MELRIVVKGQIRAALAMLRQAIESCPEAVWTSPAYPNRTWHIAYHALFFAHLYLMPDEASFVPWDKARPEYHFLDLPEIGAPYTREEMLAYSRHVEALVDPTLDLVDLAAPMCGFSWYDLPKLDHELMSARHVQHHAGQIADRLRNAAGAGIDWVGARR